MKLHGEGVDVKNREGKRCLVLILLRHAVTDQPPDAYHCRMQGGQDRSTVDTRHG